MPYETWRRPIPAGARIEPSKPINWRWLLEGRLAELPPEEQKMYLEALSKAVNIAPAGFPQASPSRPSTPSYDDIPEQEMLSQVGSWPQGLNNSSVMASLKQNSAFNRPGNVNGGDSFGNAGGGGPEDMVRSAIMQHLKYLLQPDVSAPPDPSLKTDTALGLPNQREYENLDFETPLSNSRVAEAIGPLMEMYAGVGRNRQQEQMGEQELSSARAREDYTRAQAKALEMNPSKIKPGAAMDAAKALDRTNRWLMAFEQRLKQAAGGLVIDPGLGEKSSEEAMQIAQQVKQNVQQAQKFVQRAIELENQGNVADSAYYAQQAVALLSKYDKLTQEGGAVSPAGGDRVGRAIEGL